MLIHDLEINKLLIFRIITLKLTSCLFLESRKLEIDSQTSCPFHCLRSWPLFHATSSPKDHGGGVHMYTVIQVFSVAHCYKVHNPKCLFNIGVWEHWLCFPQYWCWIPYFSRTHHHLLHEQQTKSYTLLHTEGANHHQLRRTGNLFVFALGANRRPQRTQAEYGY